MNETGIHLCQCDPHTSVQYNIRLLFSKSSILSCYINSNVMNLVTPNIKYVFTECNWNNAPLIVLWEWEIKTFAFEFCFAKYSKIVIYHFKFS